MIVKNEEKYLADCLESVKSVVDHIVIVDTGSTDNTLEIAKSYNADVYHFDWVDDFSAARNFALSRSAMKNSEYAVKFIILTK
jgi:glycosyltransferase involved in cell wall biosynthesis